jgi:hypothetical protein
MTPLQRRFVCSALTAVIVALFTIDLVEAARGGPGGGRSVSRGGAAASGSFQRSRARPQTSAQRRDNRRDTRQDVRSDRREVRQDVRSERREFRGDRREWYEDRWRRGLFVSVTSWARVGCNTVIYVNGVRYYECGGVRYERVYRGTEVVYIIAS